MTVWTHCPICGTREDFMVKEGQAICLSCGRIWAWNGALKDIEKPMGVALRGALNEYRKVASQSQPKAETHSEALPWKGTLEDYKSPLAF